MLYVYIDESIYENKYLRNKINEILKQMEIEDNVNVIFILFDAPLFTKNLEHAYERMCDS